jgi:SAM-dependent methyltransferase
MELSRIELEHLQNRIDVVCSGRKIPGITGSHGTGNIELEALFNQYTPTGRTHMLNTFILGRVLSSLRNNGFECVEPIEYLAIQPTGAGISIGEHVNIRVVIESMEHV